MEEYYLNRKKANKIIKKLKAEFPKSEKVWYESKTKQAKWIFHITIEGKEMLLLIYSLDFVNNSINETIKVLIAAIKEYYKRVFGR